eukprot:TRINITY_DN16130_c0_g1_i1.p1 TRINITY_DN16130_c0_g1~~TRINITY_DN16130_c0_g1_i1.p1  ORF type:complete len:290 (+),score=106.09 TRINITY_DN16130_c0_g1_i1:43-912(+)
MAHPQDAYDEMFAAMADRFRAAGWEARQEPLRAGRAVPDAYLHVSRPAWGDEKLNGIHLEAWVDVARMKKQGSGPPVSLHCEGGCPFQTCFMQLCSERVRPVVGRWAQEDGGDAAVHKGWVVGASKCSVCEVQVAFGATPQETMGRIAAQLERLQTLAGAIDEVIAACQEGGAGGARAFTKTELAEKYNGQGGKPFYGVADGYVVDTAGYEDEHPGGLAKILSTNDPATGYTRQAFGFSFFKGANAHMGDTQQTWAAACKRFEKGGCAAPVDVEWRDGGKITIVGKVRD